MNSIIILTKRKTSEDSFVKQNIYTIHLSIFHQILVTDVINGKGRPTETFASLLALDGLVSLHSLAHGKALRSISLSELFFSLVGNILLIHC
jgi:hypothetical protein